MPLRRPSTRKYDASSRRCTCARSSCCVAIVTISRRSPVACSKPKSWTARSCAQSWVRRRTSRVTTSGPRSDTSRARRPIDSRPPRAQADPMTVPGFDLLQPPHHFGDDDRTHAFAEFLQKHRGEVHVAVLQDYPDPDAISSALAYRLLGERCDIEVDILYEGRISHQEN